MLENVNRKPKRWLNHSFGFGEPWVTILFFYFIYFPLFSLSKVSNMKVLFYKIKSGERFISLLPLRLCNKRNLAINKFVPPGLSPFCDLFFNCFLLRGNWNFCRCTDTAAPIYWLFSFSRPWTQWPPVSERNSYNSSRSNYVHSSYV